jgi:hypothetical protein
VIRAAASVPNPPLLLPGMTGGPVGEVAELRSACLLAVGRMLLANPATVVIVGGVREVESDPPLSVTVGRMLLSEAGFSGIVVESLIAVDASAAECAAQGAALDAEGLLMMADGSARRTLKAPGYLDPRANPYDESMLALLAAADWAGVLQQDVRLAAELLVAGRASWQVAAGALRSTLLQAVVHYEKDPFGVWYPVLSYR